MLRTWAVWGRFGAVFPAQLPPEARACDLTQLTPSLRCLHRGRLASPPYATSAFTGAAQSHTGGAYFATVAASLTGGNGTVSASSPCRKHGVTSAVFSASSALAKSQTQKSLESCRKGPVRSEPPAPPAVTGVQTVRGELSSWSRAGQRIVLRVAGDAWELHGGENRMPCVTLGGSWRSDRGRPPAPAQEL